MKTNKKTNGIVIANKTQPSALRLQCWKAGISSLSEREGEGEHSSGDERGHTSTTVRPSDDHTHTRTRTHAMNESFANQNGHGR